MDDVRATLDAITELVQSARAMPMSASCVVNRPELLALLADLRAQLPVAFGQAEQVLQDKDGVLDAGRREAARIVDRARAERRRMLSSTDLLAEAEGEAGRVLEEARSSAEVMRVEVEDYVDGKLANFEIVLTKTLAAVERGRQKLAGRHELDDLGDGGRRAGEPPLP